MAKTIKFPLKLRDEFPVRSIDELRQYFDLDKIIGYYLDGKLLTWLESRYYDTEAEAIKSLDKNNVDLNRKLCQIFNVEYTDNSPGDVLSIEEKNKRLATLRQYTSDNDILNKIDQVAFNQEDLADLLDENKFDEIFLCNNSFVIPLRIEGKHYIGIGKAEAVIHSDKFVDFNSKNIVFQNIKFDPIYDKIVENENPEILYKIGIEAKNNEDYKTAFDLFKKAANKGHSNSMLQVGTLYIKGLGVTRDFNKSLNWYRKAAELGNTDAMLYIGDMYYHGIGVSKDNQKYMQWCRKAAELGDTEAMCKIGFMYAYPDPYDDDVEKDCNKAMQWYRKAAELGDTEAMYEIADMYKKGLVVPKDLQKVMKWQKKAEELKLQKALEEWWEVD